MNKADLVKALEDQVGSPKIAAQAVEAVVDLIIREVCAGGKVVITGFGTFESAHRAARTGRNPRTGEEVPIAPSQSPRFRPSPAFKAFVAAPETLPPGRVGVRSSAPRD